jgi:UDP-N-acetylglucosamine--N-acetylmuramyl-(pentapeptide) pyrophosphoryl-undecaprenol N-acetylglucosamine transferase
MNQLTQDNPRVIFAGGGTGGHVMPGLAVACELQELVPGAESLFLTSARESEQRCWQAVDNFQTARVPATPWQGAANKALFAPRFLAAFQNTLSVMRRFRPHVVVGLGSYNCVVPALVARALRRPLVLMASDVIPGKAVRTLAPLAARVLVQWDAARHHLPSSRVVVTGNPIRRSLHQATRHGARERLGLSQNKCTLLAMGGSQGAQAINEALYESLPMLRSHADWLQVLHLAGPANVQEALRRTADAPLRCHTVGFMDDMQDAYAAADFVLCRAGGSTLAEVTAMGLPSILVPYPHHKDRHQSANARVLQNAAAAVIIEQEDLSPVRLRTSIRSLTDNAMLRSWMGRRARELAQPLAARNVVMEIARLGGFDDRIDQNPQPILEIIHQQLSQAA